MTRVEMLSAPEGGEFPDHWYALSSESHFWFEWRIRAALRQIRSIGLSTTRSPRVLEVGGGTGVLRAQLEAHTQWEVDLTDLNPGALGMARQGRGRTLCYNILEERPEFLEAYEVVVLFDVLEHIPDVAPFLRSLLRHLRPGGTILLNVPALQALYGAYDRAAGHVRRYDRRTLAGEFEGTGVKALDLRYWGLPLVPLLAARAVMQHGAPPSEWVIRSGFEPPNPVANAILRVLMRCEMALPPPPLGSSLLFAARREA